MTSTFNTIIVPNAKSEYLNEGPRVVSKMQKVGFPPIRGGFHINTIPSREPPSRSWSRYKKLLIDNPKDANLLQRQKLWNFQKLNRGAFRSQITSLPDIPYRVKPSPIEKVSVGVQANLPSRYSRGQRVIFPTLTSRRVTSAAESDDDSDLDDEVSKREKIKAYSPMREEVVCDYEDDFEDSSSLEDIGLEFESVVKKKNVGTMTLPTKTGRKKEKRKRGSRDRERTSVKKDKRSILMNQQEATRAASPKSVSFAPDGDSQQEVIESAKLEPDTPAIVPAINLAPIVRDSSMHSATSGGSYVNMPLENIGHSSHMSNDPLSVLDFLSGSRTDRPAPHKTPKDKSKRKSRATDAEADRVLFQKIVGDKDIVDIGTYESFARTRPNTESQSDSAADRIVDFTKVYTRRNYTPRINDDFPQYHSVVAKETNANKGIKATPTTVNKGKPAKRGMIGIGKSY